MKPIYYCIQKSTKQVLSAGILPETWGTITGMADISEEAAADLTWANYPDYGFLTLKAALALEIPQDSLDKALQLGTEIYSKVIEHNISALLSGSDWVVTKSVETGTPIPIEWEEYRSALRDIKNQKNYPWEVVYPEIPNT